MNPYNYLLPATGSLFFGREEELRRISERLQFGRENFALIGGRRIGKTSLLRRLKSQLASDSREEHQVNRFALPVYIDLSGEGIASTADFARSVTQAINDELDLRWEIHALELDEGSLSNNIRRALINFFHQLEHVFRQKFDIWVRVILLLDECEAVVDRSWATQLHRVLRALLTDERTEDVLKVVMAGSQLFRTKIYHETSPLWNILEYRPLYVLDDVAALRLIREPMRTSLAPELEHELLRQTGGHPCLLQYLLHSCWERGPDNINLETLAMIVRAFPLRSPTFQQWQSELGPAAQRVLVELGSATYTQDELRRKLDEVGLFIAEALSALCYHGLVIEEERTGRYRQAGRMFPDWLDAMNAGSTTPVPQMRELEADVEPVQVGLGARDQGVSNTRPADPVGLDVSFRPAGPGALTVRWVADEIGTRESSFVPPYQSDDLMLVLRALDALQIPTSFAADEMERLGALGLPMVDGLLSADAHRAVGRALFGALTTDPRGATTLSTARTIAIDKGAPLALNLHFEPGEVALAALPWELLWEPGQLMPVLIRHGQESNLTRHIDLPEALPPVRAAQKPLRILAAISRANLDEAQLAAEARSRRDAWATLELQGDLTILGEVQATRRGLTDALDLDISPDIVHILCHGSYHDGEGQLLFERPNGGFDWVPASQVAAQLQGVRMVVLVACKGAIIGEGQAGAPGLLTGVAPLISAAGVPLVLAMQLTVRTEAAYRMLEVFYRNLARGRSVQAALGRARHALYKEEGDRASWYVPVLYVRSRQRGPVFMVTAPPADRESTI